MELKGKILSGPHDVAIQMESETAATHEEIWDDSALVDSWNQALEEYKKYHSIHAKGGIVDDVSKGTHDVTRPTAKPETLVASEPIAADDEEGEVDETVPMDESDETSHPPISDAQGSVDAKKADGIQAGAAAAAAAIGPQTLLSSVQDEGLKKLLMSWYYAGYYTGLYEGRQQALQETEQARKGSGS
ncbi:uncharacterized protein B0T15DRAFT_558332 [Chaetomium strumarium]|uniref:Survival Motor Neuron Gemin2-binding domain-containing protein n=1 Tax=Chaetomium strumarium TaxID=1170767 RepID=A0AAJ0GR35_9PEZI|nr:hypothetical protein B0T15DRAFT_558332 [Chaetomium strumarium]